MYTIAHRPRPRRAAAALVLALGAAACATEAPSAPDAATTAAPAPAAGGRYTLAITAPNDDAGLLVALHGAAVDSVRAVGGQAFLLEGSDAAQLAVFAADGARLDAVTVTVWTHDGAPVATLREVAARGTLAQRALAGYAVDVAPAAAR